MSTKPVSTVTFEPCRHCGDAAGFTKTRGAHYQHVCQANGTEVKLFYVKCKACGGSQLLREVRPLAPAPGLSVV